MASDLKRVSGLWLKEGRSGSSMCGETACGSPAGSRLLVFKNTKKVKGDKQPDYTLNVAPDDPAYDRGQRSANGSARGSERPQAGLRSARPPAPTSVGS